MQKGHTHRSRLVRAWRTIPTILVYSYVIAVLPFYLFFEGLSLLLKLAFRLPLPLYMLKDPQERKRARMLMYGAVSGLHGCHARVSPGSPSEFQAGEGI